MSKRAKSGPAPQPGALFPPHDSPHDPERETTLEQLHQSPRLWNVAQSRWTLRQLSQHCLPLSDLSESGVWRRLRRWKISFRRTRNHITSPDIFYREKVAWMKRVQAAANSGDIVLLYGDEHTFYRQPLAAQAWHPAGGAGKTQPRCVRHTASDTKRRTIAALNAQSGQVHWYGCSRSGIRELCRFLKKLRVAYPKQRVVMIWDNWPIHQHPAVLQYAAEQEIELVWLPTYSPWLNPIEKLWKWLKADVLTAHRNSAKWTVLRQQVELFLDQFQTPSLPLLRYCGLLAD